MQEYTIPKDSLVLVTGANGFIGSQVVNSLLELGYRVRGTVRAEKPWLNEFFESKFGTGRFETAIVSGLEDADAFVECVKDLSGVIHVATDVSFSADPSVVIPKVVAGTLNVLEAASREESVKRVVLTSSTTTTVYPKQGLDKIVIDQNTWNDDAVKGAWDENTPENVRPSLTYAASKTEGERAAFKWVAEKKPHFGFNAVLPNVTFGRILHPEISGSTMGWTRNVLSGNNAAMHCYWNPQWFIDVEDIAKLHVIALLDPSVSSERLFRVAFPFTWADIVGIFKRLRPDNDKIAQPIDSTETEHDRSKFLSAKRAEELLYSFYGKGWTGLEDSLKAGIEGH